MIAEVIRSGFEESRHRGSAVLLGADGREVLYRAGEVAAPMFPRSSNKPVQAAAMRPEQARAMLGVSGRS